MPDDAGAVDLEVLNSDKYLIVRFKRMVSATNISKATNMTEVIVIVNAEFEDHIRQDFDAYRQLSVGDQACFIGTLKKLPRYTGRLLHGAKETGSSKDPSRDVVTQTSLF